MDIDQNKDFEKLLDESVKFHGHLCPGQVIGVRLSMLGLQLVSIADPKGVDRKKLKATLKNCLLDPTLRCVRIFYPRNIRYMPAAKFSHAP